MKEAVADSGLEEKEISNLGTSKKHSETFKRTASRLYEMTASKNS